jgi:xylulokinase
MDPLLLGIDVGTTAVKAVLIDVAGSVLATASQEYPTHHVAPGWVEQDPEDWWSAVVSVIRQVADAVPAAKQEVAAIAVSSQAPTLLAVDTCGRPLRNALIWMDRRAEAEARYFEQTLGFSTITGLTGNRPDPFYVAPKILWLQRREPKVFADTHLFLQITGFINYRLSGEFSLDAAHAGLLLLRDATGAWVPQLCTACCVEPEQFPPVHDGHTIIGNITREAAELVGLRAGIPICAGTVDGAAAALEAGVVDPGTAAEMTGTSTVLIMPATLNVIEPAFITMPHALPGRKLLLGAMTSTGASLRWFLDQFGDAERENARAQGTDAFDELVGLAASVPAGNDGLIFLPYMMGERSPIWNTGARGVLSGLSLGTTKGAIVRAILEGSAFALRHNLEVAASAGLAVDSIRSVGGGARSKLWNQIKADVLGRTILLPESAVGAAYGSALLAGVAAGLLPGSGKAFARRVRIKERFEPDNENYQRYTDLYAVFRNSYEKLKPCFDETARLRGKGTQALSHSPK